MTKTILVLAANPKNTPPLRLDQEVREIDNGLQRAQKRDEFILRQKWAVRPVDIRRAMLDYKPNIVHFCGHGSGEEGIAFEDEIGQAKLVGADTLAGFFELFADQVGCVILNACYSEVQAEAIAKHIPYVIGMKEAIGDAAAIEFATAFYDALGAGKPFEFAFKLACNAIQWAGIPEYLTPTIKSRTRSIESEPHIEHPLSSPLEDTTRFIIGYSIKDDSEISVPVTQLRKHLAAIGSRTGSGKTYALRGIASRLWHQHKIPCLYLDFEGGTPEYWSQLLRNSQLFSPKEFSLNPFLSLGRNRVGTRQEDILRCFEASFNWPSATFGRVRDAIQRIYMARNLQLNDLLDHNTSVPTGIEFVNALRTLYADDYKLADCADELEPMFGEGDNRLTLNDLGKSPLILDLSFGNIKRDEIRSLLSFLILDAVYQQLYVMDRSENCSMVVFIDRIEYILQSELALELIRNLLKRSREHGVGVVFASQYTQESRKLVPYVRSFLAFSGYEADFEMISQYVTDKELFSQSVLMMRHSPQPGSAIFSSSGCVEPTIVKIPNILHV